MFLDILATGECMARPPNYRYPECYEYVSSFVLPLND